jgi:4-hydroxy-3-polyprenylbenzoate decarboxylase
MNGRHLVVAITGASGAVYGVRLCRELLQTGARVSLLISRSGTAVLKEECGLDWAGEPAVVIERLSGYFSPAPGQLRYYGEDDFFAPIASGSSAPDAMVVCPCTMGTLGRIAAGLSNTLLERAADVTLKEGRPLVLVPRETPLSAIHLENMLKLARLGVRIVPAMPGFYQQPQTVDDLVAFVVGKVLATLGVSHRLFAPWGEQ